MSSNSLRMMVAWLNASLVSMTWGVAKDESIVALDASLGWDVVIICVPLVVLGMPFGWDGDIQATLVDLFCGGTVS